MSHQFSALPGELRLKIWEYALSTRCVVAFVSGPGSGPPQQDDTRLLAQSVDLSIISQSCKEARCVYEKIRCRMMFSGSEELKVPSSMWLECSETVFYLGNGAAMEAVLNLLGSRPVCDHIEHVAVGWSTYRDLITLCKRIPMFPQLQTFTILTPAAQGVRPLTSNDCEITRLAASLFGHIEESSASEFDTDYLEAIIKDFLSPEFLKWSRKTPQVKFAVTEFM